MNTTIVISPIATISHTDLRLLQYSLPMPALLTPHSVMTSDMCGQVMLSLIVLRLVMLSCSVRQCAVCQSLSYCELQWGYAPVRGVTLPDVKAPTMYYIVHSSRPNCQVSTQQYIYSLTNKEHSNNRSSQKAQLRPPASRVLLRNIMLCGCASGCCVTHSQW